MIQSVWYKVNYRSDEIISFSIKKIYIANTRTSNKKDHYHDNLSPKYYQFLAIIIVKDATILFKNQITIISRNYSFLCI